MSLPAGTHLGSYEILAPLGAGGMGEVYRARDTKLHRDVALKVLPDALTTDSERRARLEHEARVLATLNHPNVAAIYGLEDSTGRIALVMELIHGVPLSDRIGPRGISLHEALSLAVQIAAGLEAAHKVGMVHRDLKPGNVMVTSSGLVKLLDFGLAKFVEPPASTPATGDTTSGNPSTGTGQIVGTVAYMSPEQAHGERVDTRSDLFSFGTVFYEMLTGRRPFEGPDKISTLAAILQQEPKPPAEVSALPLPREAERIVLRCLRKDRERRFQTASDLKLALEDLRDDTTSGALGTTPLRTQPARSRRRWTIAAVAAGIFGLTLAGYYFAGRESTAPAPMRQLTFEAGAAMTPAISPDGRLLAYASDRSGEGQLDIWLKQVAGGEPMRLTSGPDSKMNPQFSHDGTRLYYLGARNELFEMPALGGVSRRVLESAGPFSVSSRDDISFYVPGTGTAPGPMFVLSSGANTPSAWHPECVSAGAPVWSPDGLQIAFVGTCQGISAPAALDIIAAPRTEGTARRVGNADVQGLNPRLAWSRHGTGGDSLLITRRSGDSVNVYRVGFNGAVEPISRSAGFETWPAVSMSGDLVFVRLEQTPSVWSMRLPGDGEQPTKEASPARMFATSRDGSSLVFGRMLGIEHGQLVLKNRTTGIETVLAAHSVTLEGKDSFWPQVSPEGRRIVYRALADPAGQYFVSAEGGAPKFLSASDRFTVGSDWSPDGKVIGECKPYTRGICELNPDTNTVRELLRDVKGGQLLYPSYSWDGRWVAFMLRRSGRTVIWVTPVRDNGLLGSEEQWVRVSSDGADASRPRFSPDGSNVYYELTQGSVVTLVRQKVNVATKMPEAAPARLTTVQTIPTAFSPVVTASVVSVTRDRVFFNTVETRSSIWITKLQ